MLSALVAAALHPAHACGGFFCNNVPVEQEGEDIVFSVDEVNETTTVHVQISYTGAAEDFAWIVPVPTIPTLELSTDRLFTELGWRTAPRFNLAVQADGCDDQYPLSAADGGASYTVTNSSAEGGVTVVGEQRVGPYDTVILAAETSADLLTWLGNNGYDLPTSLDPVLAPYVAADSYFVALKLAKDTDVGQLAPLAMTYPGTGASVPIQLTSIAATPDMRLHVYVLGESRAVPASYLHVQVNDLVIDWFNQGYYWYDYGGSTDRVGYEAAITVAADEAGGHAFATDYSGSTDLLGSALYQEGRYDVEELKASPDAFTFFDRLLEQGFVGDSTMLALFQEFLPMPASLVAQGVDEQDFYNCLECYHDAVVGIPFDAEAFGAAIDERVVTPLREAQELVDAHPHLTRLTSSISPVEMTVDPTFVFNADMEQEVAIDRSATLEMQCRTGDDYDTSLRRLILADGRSYELPSIKSLEDSGLVAAEGHSLEWTYLSEIMDVYALVIEQTSSEGDPTVLVDHSEDQQAAADAWNAAQGDAETCGCNGTGSAAIGFSGLLLAGLVRRRKA
jgi:hypothetical protein